MERTVFTLNGINPSSTPILKLGIFARNEATKPQDRLIGFVVDINLEEFPLTTRRPGHRKLVEKGQEMDLLFHATKLSVELQALSLPSWEPDWTPLQSMGSHWLKLGSAYHQYFDGFEE
jgi:hypothetical protein